MSRDYVTLPPDVRIVPCVAPLSESVSWADSMLGAEEAWKLSQGEGVIVCVLDTGCDIKHPDLAGAIRDAKDFTGSRVGYNDRHSHGTHVSGLVAARMGNDIGIRGIAPKCELVIAKVLGDNGAGSDQAIASGIEWGLSKGATVFSLSLGGAFDMPATLAAAKAVTSHGGRFLLAAAGNDGGAVNKPAAYAEFVSVGAYDEDGNLTGFTSKVGRLDIVGPGVKMLSTIPGGLYGEMTGTSQACPVVAAITALALAKHRDDGSDTDLRTTADLREHLLKAATDTGRGYRLVNARKMLESHGVAPQPESSRTLVYAPAWTRYEIWRRESDA